MIVVAYLKFVGAVVFPYLHDFYFLEEDFWLVDFS